MEGVNWDIRGASQLFLLTGGNGGPSGKGLVNAQWNKKGDF